MAGVPESATIVEAMRKARKEMRKAKEAQIEGLRAQIRAAAYTKGGVDLPGFFKFLDKDASGALEREEFLLGIQRASKLKVSRETAQDFFEAVDQDGSGVISLDEFVAFFGGRESDQHRNPRAMIEAQAKRAKESNQEQGQILVGVKKAICAAAYREGGVDLWHFFSLLDRDGGGELEAGEFIHAMRHNVNLKKGKKQLPDTHLLRFFDAIDHNGDGTIDVMEFVTFCESDATTPSWLTSRIRP